MSVTTEGPTNPTPVRPFTTETPEAELEALRARVATTRWPDKETVADHSQGVQLATVQELAHYWATDYDWRKCEAKLNALPQFKTEVDGLDIHFIHARSRHENALPLIVTHGWPGSVIEQLKIIEPLTNPTAHGAGARTLSISSSRRCRATGSPASPRHPAGPCPHCPGLGDADGSPRVHPICGPRRRLGWAHHGSDGGTGAAGVARYAHQLPGDSSTGRRKGDPVRRTASTRPLSRRATRLRATAGGVQAARLCRARWERARKRCPGWPTRPSAWRPGCSTTTPAVRKSSPTPS